MPQHISDTSNNDKLDKQVKSLSELSKDTPFEIQEDIVERGIVITQSNVKAKALEHLAISHNIPICSDFRQVPIERKTSDKSLHLQQPTTPVENTKTIKDIVYPPISKPEREDLSKNSVDDSKANTLLNNVIQALHNNQETVFHIKNPYAIVEAIDETDYYKQNADTYLAEYKLIQQKQSKLSSTKRRKIVHIVETYLLT